jgi:AraC family transcriptional activator of pobA
MDTIRRNLYFSKMATSRSAGDDRMPAAGAGGIPAFFLYGEPLQPPDERLIHIETIAARSQLHDWNIRPHRHRDLHQVLFIRRGDVEVLIDEMTTRLRTTSVIVIPPGSVHSFVFQPGAAGLVISFAPRLLSDLLSGGKGLQELLERPKALALERASLRATDLPLLGQMLLREFARSAPGRHAALRGLLGALLANLMRLAGDCTEAASAARAPERELVARFRRLVEARYRTHAGINAYGEQLGVSEARLRRACLAVAAQSPIELVHLRLLIEAERLLRYTSMSIAQVAYHLGYEDPAYFSRFFTQRSGMSPREFKAQETSGISISRRRDTTAT